MFVLPRVKDDDIEEVEGVQLHLCACTSRNNKDEYFLRRRDRFFNAYHNKFIDSHYLQRSFAAHLLRIMREPVTHAAANSLRKRLQTDIRRLRQEAKRYRVGLRLNICDTCYNSHVLVDYLQKLYSGGPNPFLQINRVWDEAQPQVQTTPLAVTQPSTSAQPRSSPSPQPSLATLRRNLMIEEQERSNLSDRVHDAAQDVLRLQTELQALNEECRVLYDDIETAKSEREDKQRSLYEAREALSEVLDEAAVLIDVTTRLQIEATQAGAILRTHVERLSTLRTTSSVRTQTTSAVQALESADALVQNLVNWQRNWTELLHSMGN